MTAASLMSGSLLSPCDTHSLPNDGGDDASLHNDGGGDGVDVTGVCNDGDAAEGDVAAMTGSFDATFGISGGIDVKEVVCVSGEDISRVGCCGFPDTRSGW